MKSSRIFLVAALFAVIALGAAVGAALLLTASNVQAETIKLPNTPFKFETIYESQGLKVSIDRSTRTALHDRDNDVMSAAVFQIIRKQAKPGERMVFISVFTSLCGFPGVLPVAGKSYGFDGAEIPYQTTSEVMDAQDPSTPAGAAYKSLCANPPKPTPIDPRYKAPDRYTKFWSRS